MTLLNMTAMEQKEAQSALRWGWGRGGAQFLRLQSPTKGRIDWTHTPSIAFWHLSPNSARFGYPTEGVLFISAQLSSDAVSALRKVWVLI